MRPALERRHEVLAVALPGHHGGAPFGPARGVDGVLDDLERLLDDHGWSDAHLAGVSLGGHLALRLAERDRARSVVAFAPAGGWEPGGDFDAAALFAQQRDLHAQLRAGAAQAAALAATPEGRRRVMRLLVADGAGLPADLVADLAIAAARCDFGPLAEVAQTYGWEVDAARVRCPVRIVWGTADALVPWPRAARRLQRTFPHADWVVLDGVGHHPALDVPLESAELITGWTGG